MLELRPPATRNDLVPLAVLGAFTAFGLWWAWAGFRQMRRTRVCADTAGVSLTDGSRRGRTNQAARWDDVAHCAVEKRASSPDDVGTPHLVLKNRAGHDLFALYVRFLSHDDTARLLRFVKGELELRNAPFEVPARWCER